MALALLAWSLRSMAVADSRQGTSRCSIRVAGSSGGSEGTRLAHLNCQQG